MCGIFLLYDRDLTSDELLVNYQMMSTSIAHRGPDAMGVTAIPNQNLPSLEKTNKTEKLRKNETHCTLSNDFFQNTHGFIGHHRLAIIDLNKKATQPFLDPFLQIALSYNGVIYNYIELRQELTGLGYAFRTNSDSEVILNAYLAWDNDCIQRFNGDFALLIYDHRKKSIIGSRDRFGIKPLYFLKQNNAIYFSSELKGFLNLSGYKAALNEGIAYQYLVADFPTFSTLKQSFLKDIFSIPPAHSFEVDLDSLSMSFTRYWDIDENSFNSQSELSFNDAVKQFDTLLKDAVSIRLRSDVPIGSFLSGGMDSPSLVWHTNNETHNIPTFSSIFPGLPVDESSNIHSLVMDLNIINYQQQVDFNDFCKEIYSLVWLQDEPFSTLNVYTQFKNIQHAKNSGVKVILDGGGADEYLAGYADYRLLAAADSGDTSYLTDQENLRLNCFMTMSAEDLCSWYNLNERKGRTVNYINSEFRMTYRGNASSIDRPLDQNYKDQFIGSYLKYALLNSLSGSWMNKSIPWDNRYIDRSGMFLGIEGRVPFQDHRLIEFVFSLPHDYIYRDGFSKYILRKAMETRLPRSITSDRNKVGFEFPFCDFIVNNKEFREFFYDLIQEDSFKDIHIVDKYLVASELDNIRNGNSFNYNLWRVFNLYMWYNLFIN